MKPPATPVAAACVPGELDALLAAINEAIEAMVAWNIADFDTAVERQREICERLARQTDWRQLPGTAATARRVRELNSVYDRLLQHSVHWTHILQSIFEANGHSLGSRASVHFRG